MIKVAINGYGRIGRAILRAVYERNLANKIDIVAINELADANSLAHLTKYDSTHGNFAGIVSFEENKLIVNNNSILLYNKKNPEDLNWESLGLDLVFEASGTFSTRQELQKFRVDKVLAGYPADLDNLIVYGVNDDSLTADHKLVSNASCTTNCVIPVIDALDNEYGVKKGMVTTIHSMTNDQQVIDSYGKDLRFSRAASHSIIPVGTKLAQGIERILPKMQDKFSAIALRVPTINVTAMDLNIELATDVTIDDINSFLDKTSKTCYKGVLGFSYEPLISSDYNHDSRSSIIDGTQTQVSSKRLVKLLLWCDNEWGFANRMLDTAMKMLSCK